MAAAPLMRSRAWALAVGVAAGTACGVWHATALEANLTWRLAGGVAGALVGAVSAGDLLIAGPGRERQWSRGRGRRIGPFRTGAFLLVLMGEGLVVAARLSGGTTLTCERRSTGVSCRQTTSGWFGQRTVDDRRYEPVVAAALDLHGELLLHHGAEGHGEVAAGFADQARTAVQAVIDGSSPSVRVAAETWTARIDGPVVALLAGIAGLLGALSVRTGLRALAAERGRVGRR